ARCCDYEPLIAECHVFFSPLPSPTICTLFPYTTLFRSPAVGSSNVINIRIIVVLPEPEGPMIHIFSDGAMFKSIPLSTSKKYVRSEEHTSELQSRFDLVCRLLLVKKKAQEYHTEVVVDR